jgi:hypothetical protein
MNSKDTSTSKKVEKQCITCKKEKCVNKDCQLKQDNKVCIICGKIINVLSSRCLVCWCF